LTPAYKKNEIRNQGVDTVFPSIHTAEKEKKTMECFNAVILLPWVLIVSRVIREGEGGEPTIFVLL